MNLFVKHSYQLLLRLAMAFLMLRIVEKSIAAMQHSVPSDLVAILLNALTIDAVVLTITAVFLVLVGLPFMNKPIARNFIQSIIGAFLLLVYSALSHYFITTQVLLGADFFSYSSKDIALTIKASESFNLIVVLLYVLPQVVFWLPLAKKYNHLGANKYTQWLISIFIILAMLSSVFTTKLAGTSSYWAQNKLSHFFTQGFKYVADANKPDIENNTSNWSDKYYHFANQNNIIAPLLSELSEKPPSILFILVKGLGTDFLAGGKFAGYMPFLDSLTGQSAYWPNTLSTTGRTFGSLPSILGGLPYPQNGFMDLGPNYPAHLTMLSIAKANRVSTNYYYGGDAKFNNQDLFLAYQGIDNIYDEKDMLKGYKRMKANDVGFSRGYPDGEVFKFYVDTKKENTAVPSIDIILTLSTHEPFLVEDEACLEGFDKLYQSKIYNENDRSVISTYLPIFQSLYYTDQKLKALFKSLQELPQFNNTLVFITGDHRVIPLPFENLIERFKVPLIMYSNNLKKPRVFESVQTHSDIYPSIIGLYSNNYQFNVPARIFSMGAGLDTAIRYTSTKIQPLMINKGVLSHLMYQNNWVSNGEKYQLGQALSIKHNTDPKADSLDKVLLQLNSEMEQLCKENLLLPDSMPTLNFNHLEIFEINRFDEEWLIEKGLDTTAIDNLLFTARDFAFDKHYIEARLCLKYLLNKSPNYSDARILLGRTYAWDDQFNVAEKHFMTAIHRDPTYEDAYIALADNYKWSGNRRKAIETILLGLERVSDSELLAQKLIQLEK